MAQCGSLNRLWCSALCILMLCIFVDSHTEASVFNESFIYEINKYGQSKLKTDEETREILIGLPGDEGIDEHMCNATFVDDLVATGLRQFYFHSDHGWPLNLRLERITIGHQEALVKENELVETAAEQELVEQQPKQDTSTTVSTDALEKPADALDQESPDTEWPTANDKPKESHVMSAAPEPAIELPTVDIKGNTTKPLEPYEEEYDDVKFYFFLSSSGLTAVRLSKIPKRVAYKHGVATVHQPLFEFLISSIKNNQLKPFKHTYNATNRTNSEISVLYSFN